MIVEHGKEHLRVVTLAVMVEEELAVVVVVDDPIALIVSLRADEELGLVQVAPISFVPGIGVGEDRLRQLDLVDLVLEVEDGVDVGGAERGVEDEGIDPVVPSENVVAEPAVERSLPFTVATAAPPL